jgi:hypothetical protein
MSHTQPSVSPALSMQTEWVAKPAYCTEGQGQCSAQAVLVQQQHTLAST